LTIDNKEGKEELTNVLVQQVERLKGNRHGEQLTVDHGLIITLPDVCDRSEKSRSQSVTDCKLARSSLTYW
jgi:hypothetical protein